MTVAILTTPTTSPSLTWSLSPRWARVIVAVAIVAAGLGAIAATDTAASARAIADAGLDLTHLLRAMAAIKAVVGACAAAGVFWRLALPVSTPRLVLYAGACAAMAAGPALIWTMTHLVAGALLLHAGLAVTAVMLWRDPAVGARLSAAVAERRRRR